MLRLGWTFSPDASVLPHALIEDIVADVRRLVQGNDGLTVAAHCLCDVN